VEYIIFFKYSNVKRFDMQKQNVIVREMRDEDIVMVSDIICAGYTWLAQTEGFTSEELRHLIDERGSIDAISKQSKDCSFLVAVIDNNIVGMASIFKNEIAKLYVTPDWHNQGIGSALFNAAEKRIVDEGYSVIRLVAFPSSIKFYKAMGMKIDGEKTSTRGPLKGRAFVHFRKSIT
jgi:ribosomal protein S18 acetylase RimI-like enzyme